MSTSPPGPSPLSDADFDLSDRLGDESDNPVLRDLILDEICTRGPMTFHRFMDLALYHPALGYYTSERLPVGREQDYVTSPEISPLFGYALGRQLSELWCCLGRPARFDVTECGAGSGRMAHDILRWLTAQQSDCYASIFYHLVDSGSPARAAQRRLLEPWIEAGKVAIGADLPTQQEMGCVLANELVDSFPVHRVTVQKGKLLEMYVALEHDRLVDRPGSISTPELESYFDRLGLLPGEGCVAEVNLDGPAWIDSAAQSVKRGFILLLDYGYPVERLYAPWRRDGTLLCYRQHAVSDDPYVNLGHQDITAHVDFTTLASAALQAGFASVAFTDQARFLTGLAIGSSVRIPAQGETGIQQYFRRRRAVEALLDGAGLGRIGVSLMSNVSCDCTFSGFAGAMDSPRPEVE